MSFNFKPYLPTIILGAIIAALFYFNQQNLMTTLNFKTLTPPENLIVTIVIFAIVALLGAILIDLKNKNKPQTNPQEYDQLRNKQTNDIFEGKILTQTQKNALKAQEAIEATYQTPEPTTKTPTENDPTNGEEPDWNPNPIQYTPTPTITTQNKTPINKKQLKDQAQAAILQALTNKTVKQINEGQEPIYLDTLQTILKGIDINITPDINEPLYPPQPQTHKKIKLPPLAPYEQKEAT